MSFSEGIVNHGFITCVITKPSPNNHICIEATLINSTEKHENKQFSMI